jgi:two-component system nitrate/nitrite sensor histidine kinase NarX
VLTAIDAALAEARQAVMAMRADPSRGSTLEDVLDSYVDDFADRFGLRAEFQADGVRGRLAPRSEAEVLRIVQEALNNVRRHADATLVRVSVERPDGRVRVTVADNGKGFDPESVGDDRYGLRGMRERAEMVGAELRIDSRPADGTRIILDLPAAEAAT